jgi:ABC-type dipeptide/oligopeptide/nickel transport system permease subunit
MTSALRLRRVRAALMTLAVILALAALSNVMPDGGLWVRTFRAAQGTLLVTLGVLGLALPSALVFGLLAGGLRLFDALLARLVELTGALPTLIMIAVCRALGEPSSVLALLLPLALVRAVHMARLVRSEVLRVTSVDFVTGARAIGASPLAVLGRHVAPHVLSPLLVSAAFTAAAVVSLEAALSFVGLGLPYGASWGALLAEVRGPAVLLPVCAVVVTSGAFYVVADALDDVWQRSSSPAPTH